MIKRRAGLAALVLAAGLVAAPVARADAGPAGLHDMRGHFALFTRTAGDRGIRPGSLDITTQVGPVLIGRANLTGRSVPVTGSISATGAVTLTGLDGLSRLSIRAQSPDLGGFQPCIFEGRFQVSAIGGPDTFQGDLVAVHQVPVAGAPSIGGNWAGVMIQDVSDRRTPVQATFTQTRAGALTGRMFNPQPDSPGFGLTLAGQVTIGGPDTRPEYLLIGAGPEFLATALLTPTGTTIPGLSGPIRLLPADGTAHRATLHLDRATR
jgi:hypothetical protein